MNNFKNGLSDTLLNTFTTFGGGTSSMLGATYILATSGTSLTVALLYGGSIALFGTGIYVENKRETVDFVENKLKDIDNRDSNEIKIKELYVKLSNITDKKMYLPFSKTINMISSVLDFNKKVRIDSNDYILIKRMVNKYIPELIDNYNLLNHKNSDDDEQKIKDTLRVMQGKLTEIENAINSEASRNISNISSMSNEILKNDIIIDEVEDKESNILKSTYEDTLNCIRDIPDDFEKMMKIKQNKISLLIKETAQKIFDDGSSSHYSSGVSSIYDSSLSESSKIKKEKYK